MASQEEVEDAIVYCGGCATLRRLKQIFGLEGVKGSSFLSQRLTAMVQKKVVRRIIVDNQSAYQLLNVEVTQQMKETAYVALKQALRGVPNAKI